MAIDDFSDSVYRGSAAMQFYPGVVRIAIAAVDYMNVIDDIQVVEYLGDFVAAHAPGKVQYLYQHVSISLFGWYSVAKLEKTNIKTGIRNLYFKKT
jgi:hypothetical protein